MTRFGFAGLRLSTASFCHTLQLASATALVCLGAQDTALAQASGDKQQGNTTAREKPTASSSANVSKVKFRPPSTGAPSVRLTGGSRGAGDTLVTLDVLAPDDVGLTTQEQPSLFWYQSKPATAKIEVTLLQENQVKPLLQVRAERALNAGIQRVRLSDHGAKLATGVEYQWVVALILDPENRSSDLVASGVIKRVEPSADLKKRLAAATPETLAAAYAEAGIWYDALSQLSDRIEADPGNKALLDARTDLLRQAGLRAAANPTLAARQ